MTGNKSENKSAMVPSGGSSIEPSQSGGAVQILSTAAIAQIGQQLQLAEHLVETVLEEEVDYGKLPGVQTKALFDPGANKIMSAFNCYPVPYIIQCSGFDDPYLFFDIRVELIQRGTGAVVGVGVGASSTQEVKHRYRWVEDPESYNFPPEGLQTKEQWGKLLYRIPNPEFEDLRNNILKMATKRAEVDATSSLPGVGSALRKVLGQVKWEWPMFWSKMRDLNLSDDEVHALLKVKTLNVLFKEGMSVYDIYRKVLAALENSGRRPPRRSKQATSDPLPGGEDAHSRDRSVGDPDETALDPDDPLMIGWQMVKSSLAAHSFHNEWIRKWWADSYGMEVNLKDFDKEYPPEIFSNSNISSFYDALSSSEENGGDAYS